MKNFFYLLVITALVSCGSADNKKETPTPNEIQLGKLDAQKAKAKGYHFEVDGKKMTEAKVPYGASIVLVLEGIEGFKEEAGKVACDASIEVQTSKGEQLVLLDSLFEESYSNGMLVELFKSKVELSLICQKPLKMNETYKIKFTLYDKKSGAKMVISENFSMVPSKGLSYEAKGINSDGFFIYVNSNGKAQTDNTLSGLDTLNAYCSGVDGLVIEGGTVRPDASIVLYTQKGEVISEFKDLYKEYEKSGVAPETVYELVNLELILPPTLQAKTNYYIVFKIGDKKGSGTITARYDFITN